jgi:hypothetical protein
VVEAIRARGVEVILVGNTGGGPGTA